LDAPKAVIALAGLLVGAGYPGIAVTACLACGREDKPRAADPVRAVLDIIDGA
jgi:hypothetical protein